MLLPVFMWSSCKPCLESCLELELTDPHFVLVETPTDSGQADLETPVENMKRDVTAVLKKMSSSFKRDVLHRSYTASDTERSLQDVC